MAKVELYFGQGHLQPGAWARFLHEVITPRFPDGLTSWDARGQWRGSRGLEKEASRVVVIFYRPDAAADERIETIRDMYRHRFNEASVLRADTVTCVGF